MLNCSRIFRARPTTLLPLLLVLASLGPACRITPRCHPMDPSCSYGAALAWYVPACRISGGNANCPLNLTGFVTTLAGSTSGYADGTGTAALFVSPGGITSDGTNLFVVDWGDHKLRKIVIESRVVTTLAGNTSGYADGTGTAALFANPTETTTDGTDLYVADSTNNRIRKVAITDATVTTYAGNGPGSADGTGTAALFNNPNDITTDGTNLYVADLANHRIRKIAIATGVVTTLAGNTIGYADGTGTAALFSGPEGVMIHGADLYVADSGNNRIRKIVIATGVVTTLAGNTAGYADGTGTAALFNYPNDIATDGTNLYVSDANNNRIRTIVIATGAVATLAGNTSGYADGTGTAALFSAPNSITTDGTSLFVSDFNNSRIRRIQ